MDKFVAGLGHLNVWSAVVELQFGGAARPLGPVFETRFEFLAYRVHMLVVRGEVDHLERARLRVEELLTRWSPSHPHSDIARIITRPGRNVSVAIETLGLLGIAEIARKETRGAFDVVSPTGARPTTDTRRHTVCLPVGSRLRIAGLECGLIADMVVRDILDAGAMGACVNINGDLRVGGVPPRLEGWIVNLAPTGMGSEQGALVLAVGALATRGGYPTIRQVTVHAETAWRASVLAVAARRLGVSQGLQLLEDNQVSAVLVDDAGTWHSIGRAWTSAGSLTDPGVSSASERTLMRADSREEHHHVTDRWDQHHARVSSPRLVR